MYVLVDYIINFINLPYNKILKYLTHYARNYESGNYPITTISILLVSRHL